MNFIVIVATGRGTSQRRIHFHILNATSRVDAHNAFNVLAGGDSIRDDNGDVWEFVTCIEDTGDARRRYREDNADVELSTSSLIGGCSPYAIDARTGNILYDDDDASDPVAILYAFLTSPLPYSGNVDDPTLN